MPDELDAILRMVAQGHLRAEEAAPIIEALLAGAGPRAASDSGAATPGSGAGSGGDEQRRDRRGPEGDRHGGGGGSRQLRVEVLEHGRQVVNLRVPLGLASLAVDRVPGLPGHYRDPIREAIRTGMTGPIVDVGDGDDRVRVVLE